MHVRAKGFTALCALAVLVAGCGGSSGAPDVTGGPASDSATLFKASNLTKVLNQAKGELGGTPITVLKVEPRDVKIIGQNKTVTVDNNGQSVVINTPSIPGPATFDLTVVSPTTIEKAVNAVESKGRLKQSDIAYVAIIVDPIDKKALIGVYPTSGRGHYQANINGGNLKAIGTSSAAAPSGGAIPGGGATPSGGTPGGAAVNPQAISNCVSKAGGDPAQIAKCTGG